MSIAISVDNRTKLGHAGPLIQSEIRAFLQRATLTVEGKVKPLTPVVTGTLRRSIHNEITSWHTGRVGTNLVYARYIETGERRGKRGTIRRRRGPARMFAQGAEQSRMPLQALATDAARRIVAAVA